MLELGSFSKDLHQKVGKVVAENKIDKLITVGKKAENIAEAALNSGMEKENILICKNNIEAIEFVKSMVKDNDIFLIKASNGMNFKQIVEALNDYKK